MRINTHDLCIFKSYRKLINFKIEKKYFKPITPLMFKRNKFSHQNQIINYIECGFYFKVLVSINTHNKILLIMISLVFV
jgi:hypothetical protein